MSFDDFQQEITASADNMLADVFDLFRFKLFIQERTKELREERLQYVANSLEEKYSTLMLKYALAKMEYHRLSKRVEEMGGWWKSMQEQPHCNSILFRITQLDHYFNEIAPLKATLRFMLASKGVDYKRLHPAHPFVHSVKFKHQVVLD